jgi:selenocysteine-specific elongation factor
LLKIQAGIVVMTKIDLADDPDWLNLVEEDIRNILIGTVLQNAPILRVSSRTNAGIPDLLKNLSLVLGRTPMRHNLGRPRLPVDRVFTISGFGTVVTGTLSDGNLTIGDDVEILPSGFRGRIRGLQTHKVKEETAVAGSRTAVNISGLNVEQIQRGEVVTHPGQYRVTQRLDADFRLLPDVSAPLRHHTEVKIFVGTSETLADVRLLGAETIKPGETGWLQIELRRPIVTMHGDRFILRRPSPSETLGGGMVVDPQPKKRHKRFDKQVLIALDVMTKGNPKDLLLQASLNLGPSPIKDIINKTQLDGFTAEPALKELLDSDQIVNLEGGAWTMGSTVIAKLQWTALKESVIKVIVSYHETYPLRHGMPREELKSRLKLTPRIFNLILQKMALEGVLHEASKWVSLPDHKVRYSPFQQVKVDKLLAQFTAAPYAPPSIKECVAEVGDDLFNALRESGDLVVVSDEVVFYKVDYETVVDNIRKALMKKGQITLAEVRDLLKTSRKYVQAILEHLDAIGVTLRDGDHRRLRN